jgi:hypothetical protein
MSQEDHCPSNLEDIIVSVVKEVGPQGPTNDVRPAHYLMHDLGFSSIETFEIFALIDARLRRRFPYESLIVRDGTIAEDLTIGEIVSFIRENWNEEDVVPLAR